MNKKPKFSILAMFMLIMICGVLLCPLKVNAATGFNLTQTGATETTVTLSWSKSTDVWFYNYILWFSSEGTNGPWTQLWTSDGDSSHNIHAVSNLLPNTQYWFYIEDKGLSVDYQSNTFEATTANIASLSITSKTSTTASLSWTDYDYGTAIVPFKSYVIQMSTDNGPWATLDTITDNNQDTYMVTGLSPASYRFRLLNNYGNFSTSSNIPNMTINRPLDLQISQQSSAVVGEQVQLKATVSGGTGSYSYQWFKEGIQMSIGTGPYYSFSPERSGDFAIKCVVADKEDSTLSSVEKSLTLTVVSATIQPSYQAQTQAPSYTAPEQTNGNSNANNANNIVNSDNQMATTMILIVVLVIAVIVVVVFVVKKNSKHP